MAKYYPPSGGPCVACHFARMRTDICGIYCTGGFVKPDGTCDKFKPYKGGTYGRETERKSKKVD